MLLGYLIEAVTGRPLDVFLTEALYEPLGLHATAFQPRSHDLKGFAVTSHGNPFEKRMVADDDFGYLCDEDPNSFTRWRTYVLDGEVNDGNAYHANNGVAGHAGLFSTASELNVLMTLLLNEGVYEGNVTLPQVRSHAVPGEMFLTKLRRRGKNNYQVFVASFANGLGWAMSTNDLPADSLPEGSFGHTGFTGTYALGVPGEDFSIILLTNRQNNGVQSSGDYHSVDPLRREITALLLSSLQRGAFAELE